MKKGTKKSLPKNKKRRRLGCIYLMCWVIIPAVIIIMLFLDALGLYCFNCERLLVLGACLMVVLVPFFSEITIKNISVKRDTDTKYNHKIK